LSRSAFRPAKEALTSVAPSQPVETKPKPPFYGPDNWKEHVPPAVLIEYFSEDGSKERDQTPYEGKFWIYEQAVRGGYYAIFVVGTGEL
jgi:hypothetical protein